MRQAAAEIRVGGSGTWVNRIEIVEAGGDRSVTVIAREGSVTRAARWALAAWLALCARLRRADRAHRLQHRPLGIPAALALPGQQVLVEQLRDGVVSRLVLIGIEGAPPERLAEASRRLAAALRASRALRVGRER